MVKVGCGINHCERKKGNSKEGKSGWMPRGSGDEKTKNPRRKKGT